MNRTLRLLNEKPLPLPIVYLHPSVKKEYTKLYMGNVGFDITIPFKEIIEHHEEYMRIENSKRYLTQMKEDLKKCKTEKEVQSLLETMSISHQIPPPTANKIRAEFETLFEEGMTDIDRKSTRLNSSHTDTSRMPSAA